MKRIYEEENKEGKLSIHIKKNLKIDDLISQDDLINALIPVLKDNTGCCCNDVTIINDAFDVALLLSIKNNAIQIKNVISKNMYLFGCDI